MSFQKIYQEQINDLLSKNINHSLEIRENAIRGIHIPKLTEINITSYEQAMELFNNGELLRRYGDTEMNEHSSRSHTIFRINYEMRGKNRPDKVITSQLNLVDLAGSEDINKAKAEGNRKKEGLHINKSLLALSNVIMRLKERQDNEKCFINFRDSKLTRFLQNSLSGNSKTAVICTINPSFANQ